MTVAKILADLNAIPTAVASKEDAIREAVVSEIKATAGAGCAPDGTPWVKTATGEQPLKNADQHVVGSSKTVGSRVAVVTKVRGHYALHDMGRANGAPRRQILPDAITPAIKAVIDREVGNAFKP